MGFGAVIAYSILVLRFCTGRKEYLYYDCIDLYRGRTFLDETCHQFLQACSSVMTELIRGEKITEAWKLKIADIIHYLENIFEQKYECMEIAQNTLQNIPEPYSRSRGMNCS